MGGLNVKTGNEVQYRNSKFELVTYKEREKWVQWCIANDQIVAYGS